MVITPYVKPSSPFIRIPGMHVCIYVCMYLYIHVYTCRYTHTHICVYMYIYSYICMYIHICYAYIYIYMYVKYPLVMSFDARSYRGEGAEL